jgi:DNA-binding response OmpR family regulator
VSPTGSGLVCQICAPHNFFPFADLISMASICVEPLISNVAHPSVQLLLVEDDPESAQLTYSMIRPHRNSPFRVEWSDTVWKAMSRLARPGIDVILLDLGMPELSGYRTHSAITSVVGKTVPVVILTSDDSQISRGCTSLMGATNYLIKSQISSAELRQSLHEAVRSRL